MSGSNLRLTNDESTVTHSGRHKRFGTAYTLSIKELANKHGINPCDISLIKWRIRINSLALICKKYDVIGVVNGITDMDSYFNKKESKLTYFDLSIKPKFDPNSDNDLSSDDNDNESVATRTATPSATATDVNNDYTFTTRNRGNSLEKALSLYLDNNSTSDEEDETGISKFNSGEIINVIFDVEDEIVYFTRIDETGLAAIVELDATEEMSENDGAGAARVGTEAGAEEKQNRTQNSKFENGRRADIQNEDNKSENENGNENEYDKNETRVVKNSVGGGGGGVTGGSTGDHDVRRIVITNENNENENEMNVNRDINSKINGDDNDDNNNMQIIKQFNVTTDDIKDFRLAIAIGSKHNSYTVCDYTIKSSKYLTLFDYKTVEKNLYQTSQKLVNVNENILQLVNMISISSKKNHFDNQDEKESKGEFKHISNVDDDGDGIDNGNDNCLISPEIDKLEINRMIHHLEFYKNEINTILSNAVAVNTSLLKLEKDLKKQS